MSKLIKLKAWLTVAETAQHLSNLFEEQVTEADILRLALDRQMGLSVRFVNDATGIEGSIVPIADAPFLEVPALIGEGTVKLYRGEVLYTNGVESSVVVLGEEIKTLRGVFDLPMIGAERLDIEHKYQMLTGGAEVTDVNLSGAFVEGAAGRIYQLQKSLDDNEYQPGSQAALERLKAKLAGPRSLDYFPAGLPEDATVVVRVGALAELLKHLSGGADKPESPRKTENLLRALVSIAIDAYGYDPQAGKSTAPKDISDAMSKHGFTKDEKTVRGWLKEGAEMLPVTQRKD